MSVTITDEVLQAARMSEEELRQELATLLYQREKLTLAQASRLAGLNQFQLQHLAASRGIPVHYGIEDFEQDLKTLRALSPR
jgi:predicted HTH domain antitoxin